MTLKAFVTKHWNGSVSLRESIKDSVSEVDNRINQRERTAPTHITAQKTLLQQAFDTDETVWVFVFDAGRYDLFDQLYPEYLDGKLQRCYNGGVAYTGDWAMKHLRYDFGERGVFSYLPFRGLAAVEYDGRNWFEIAPDIDSEHSAYERLAELGYAERQINTEIAVDPGKVNETVRQHNESLAGGLIRYIAPHPPFDGLEDLTSESTKTVETQAALDTGSLSYQELTDAYKDTYRKAFRHAVELIPELDGEIYITADHGTCLTCGQLFHGRQLDKHDHLCIVPWFKVGGVA